MTYVNSIYVRHSVVKYQHPIISHKSQGSVVNWLRCSGIHCQFTVECSSNRILKKYHVSIWQHYNTMCWYWMRLWQQLCSLLIGSTPLYSDKCKRTTNNLLLMPITVSEETRWVNQWLSAGWLKSNSYWNLLFKLLVSTGNVLSQNCYNAPEIIPPNR